MTNLAQPISTLAVQPLNLPHDGADIRGGFLEQLLFRTAGLNETAQATDGVAMIIFWVGLFFFVLLMTLMCYWTWRYRRRPGVPAPKSPSHNTPLELVWTIVPSAILVVIFFLGFWAYIDKQIAPANAIELKVTGYKWGWEIEYPNGAASAWQLPLDHTVTEDGRVLQSVQSVPVFAVPEGGNIKLRMTSRDVIHSFWIPDLRVKMDIFPNRYSGFAFAVPELPPGQEYVDHWVFCAEYCGTYHSEMAAIMRVVPRVVYDRLVTEEWLIDEDAPPIEIGQLISKRQCYTCHSIDGSQNIGPTWLNAYGYDVPLQGGGTVPYDENYIRESILVPGAKIHAGYPNQMPVFDFSERELEGLIQYIRSLSDRAPAPEPDTGSGTETSPAEGSADEQNDGDAGGDAAETS